MTKRTRATGLKRTLLSRAALIALALGSAALAQAREYKSWLDIPAQSLESALKEFGVETDSQVMFAKDVVAGRASVAVKGVFTPREALNTLLQGSGLRVEQSAEKVFLVRTTRSSAKPRRRKSARSGASPPIST